MKKFLLALVVICGLLVFAGPTLAQTYYVGSTNVGELDTWLASGILGSGDATELNWVNNSLITLGKISTPFTSMTKYDTPKGTGWSVTNDPAVYAIDFASGQPEFFFIKIGAGAQDLPYTHYLYQNVADFNWGVINLSQQGYEIKNIGKFSHIGEIGGTAVPEPSLLLLLGAGLVGIGVATWRKTKGSL